MLRDFKKFTEQCCYLSGELDVSLTSASNKLLSLSQISQVYHHVSTEAQGDYETRAKIGIPVRASEGSQESDVNSKKLFEGTY